VLLDLGIDVLVPPLSRLAVAAALGLLLAVVGGLVAGGFRVSGTVFGASVAAIVLYVLRGWMVSETGARGLLDLALAPGYVAWKIALRLRRRPATSEWVRTSREAERPETPS
jgi:hypothetical protein